MPANSGAYWCGVSESRKSISLVLVDDQRLFRESLQALLHSQGFKILAHCGDAREGSELIARLAPDIALLDIDLPGLNGLQAAYRIARRTPRTKILILSQYADEEYLLQALLEVKVAGYLLKSDAPSELFGALQTVAAGKRYLSPAVTPAILDRLSATTPGRRSEALSRREQEILSLIAQGATAKMIGQKLQISPKTVQAHRTHLAEKLRLHSTADLVRYALKHKLVRIA
ncbi:MAG TPA: response regulator transcription factor [Candidatus Binataceae bacterium]|nr:response regulator transcription factor [Candidatus Binataceae bacterium]